MWPTLAEVHTSTGPMGLHTYGLFILAAFCSAFVLTHMRALRIGLHPDRVIPLYVAAAVGGLAGGRLLYAFAVDWERTIANPLSLFQPAGFAVYGGVLGGAIAVGIAAVVQRIRLWKLADIAGPAVLLGMGVGRMGCFFAGCCHGTDVHGFEEATALLPEAFRGGQIWLSGQFPFVALEFASGNGNVTRAELQDLPLYPTQLWAAVSLTGLAALLSWKWDRKAFDGQIAALSLIIEPFFRIFIESFRADHRGYALSWEVSAETAAAWPGLTQAGAQMGQHVMGVTTSQAIGAVTVIAGIAIYVLRRNAGVGEEIPVRTDDEDWEDAPA